MLCFAVAASTNPFLLAVPPPGHVYALRQSDHKEEGGTREWVALAFLFSLDAEQRLGNLRHASVHAGSFAVLDNSADAGRSMAGSSRSQSPSILAALCTAPAASWTTSGPCRFLHARRLDTWRKPTSISNTPAFGPQGT
eukprot:3100220-Rhodomonas_salina.1